MAHEADIPPRAFALAKLAVGLAASALAVAGSTLALCLRGHGLA